MADSSETRKPVEKPAENKLADAAAAGKLPLPPSDPRTFQLPQGDQHAPQRRRQVQAKQQRKTQKPKFFAVYRDPSDGPVKRDDIKIDLKATGFQAATREALERAVSVYDDLPPSEVVVMIGQAIGPLHLKFKASYA